MFDAPLKSEKLDDILSSLRHGLEQLLGDQLESVYLYGSRAREDARPNSDIDVLVVLKNDFDYAQMLKMTIDRVADLSLQNDVVISTAFVISKNYEEK